MTGECPVSGAEGPFLVSFGWSQVHLSGASAVPCGPMGGDRRPWVVHARRFDVYRAANEFGCVQQLLRAVCHDSVQATRGLLHGENVGSSMLGS